MNETHLDVFTNLELYKDVGWFLLQTLAAGAVIIVISEVFVWIRRDHS